jgi:DUF917 family protein
MSNKRIHKKKNKTNIKIVFKNEFQIAKMKASPKLTFRQLIIIFDYCTYNILKYADDKQRAQNNLKGIIDLRAEDMDGEV